MKSSKLVLTGIAILMGAILLFTKLMATKNKAGKLQTVFNSKDNCKMILLKK